MFNGGFGRGLGVQESEAAYLQEVINMIIKNGLETHGGKLRPDMMQIVSNIVHTMFIEIRKMNLAPQVEHEQFVTSIKNLAAKSGIRL
jgi:hypothetical protein